MGIKLFGLEISKTKAVDNRVNQQVNTQIGNFLTAYSRYFTITPEPIRDGVEAFASVTDVYAIVQYISQKFSTVPCEVYSIKDQKAYKQYRYLIKNKQIKEAAIYQKKAMDEQITDNAITRILKRPNLQQGQDSFFQQVMGFRLSGGAAPIWLNKGEGQNGEPLSMHCLLPSLLELKPTENNPFYADRFQFDKVGIDLTGDMKDLIYWRYWSPQFNSSTFIHLYGFSPLQAAAYTMSSNQEAQKAALSMFKNKGVNGVLFPDMGNEVIPQPHRDKMREDINRYANNNDNRGGLFLAGAKLGYIDVGSTAGEMDLIKSMNLTKQQLCNVFQFPYALFDGQTTFNNVEGAGKQLITNKIMPEWTSFADQLNSQLVPQFKGSGGYVIEPDFSCMYEMQEEAKKLIETYTPLFDRGMITANEVREMVGFDPTTQPEHNEYFINTNYQLLTDAVAPVDVPVKDNSLLNE